MGEKVYYIGPTYGSTLAFSTRGTITANPDDTDISHEARDAYLHWQGENMAKGWQVSRSAVSHLKLPTSHRSFDAERRPKPASREQQAFFDSADAAAYETGDFDELRRMLRSGISPDTVDVDGQTALMIASVNGHHKLALFLLDHGAYPHIMNKHGENALTHAALAVVQSPLGRAYDITAALLDFGAELPSLAPSERGCPVTGDARCSLAPAKATVTVAKVRRELLAARAVNSTLPEAYPGAVTAARHGFVEIIRRQLELGMHPDARDEEGSCLLMIASFDARIEVLELLLQHGADTQMTDLNLKGLAVTGANALTIAAMSVEFHQNAAAEESIVTLLRVCRSRV